jgi:hypothetical protein
MEFLRKTSLSHRRGVVEQRSATRIAALYAIEEEIRGRSAEERREVQNERSRPLLELLVVRRDLGQAIEKIRQHEGHSLRAGTLGGRYNNALLRRGPPGDRQ